MKKKDVLVSAKLGDFVVVYSDSSRLNNWNGGNNIGVVTSIRNTKDGICYGCRHIQFDPDKYRWELLKLTDEDYGAYPTGFVRVLTKKEALSLLKRNIKKDIEKRFKEDMAKLSRIDEHFTAAMKKLGTRATVEMLDPAFLDEE